MKHLFIINPAAKRVRGRVGKISGEINAFFESRPALAHDIYVSGWCRDAVAYIRSYIRDARALKNNERIRVHTIGGTGTLFEVVNGVIGFDNVDVAVYPYGGANVFLRYFGSEKMGLFSSIDSQVFGDSVPIDAIRSGYNYGICYGIAGLEAYCDAAGDRLIERGVPVDLSYVLAAVARLLGRKKIWQRYNVELDGKRLDGKYLSILIANIPCYGTNFHPAADAHPDSGRLEIYMIKASSRIKHLLTTSNYLKGGCERLDIVVRCAGRRINVSSDEVMCMNIDSETFYGTHAEFELLPGAVRVVLPEKIDLGALPLKYNRPKEGLRNEQKN